MKNAVITINIGNKFNKMADMTIPLMKEYADRIGASFIEVRETSNISYGEEYSAYWAKFKLFNYLEKFERVIYLDLDVVVRPHCPNLFQIVPENKFAALYETDYQRINSQLEKEIEEFKNENSFVDWNGDYFNVGVMVASRQHKNAFLLDANQKGGNRYPEQTLINYNVNKQGYETYHLPYTFNHMYFLSVDNHKRDQSSLIHYAAIPQEVREKLIAYDLKCFDEGLPLVTEIELNDFIANNFEGKSISDFEYALQKDSEIGLERQGD
ncbi:glycosyltransferase [Pseudoalteromonas rhizosphaerae]|uniref:glycosyltransferase n=1 Tax=Pseudoalteromonas rhizosphaerae TaxID=2518973 RepID=UPI00384F5C83